MSENFLLEIWVKKQKEALKKIVFLSANTLLSSEDKKNIAINSWREAVLDLVKKTNNDLSLVLCEMGDHELIDLLNDTKISFKSFFRTIDNVLISVFYEKT